MFVRSSYFEVGNVEISGTERYVNSMDMREVVKNNAYGKNLILLPTQKLQSDLKSVFLGAKEITISKQLPKTLKITVFERRPLAIIYNDTEYSYLVDDEGYVLGLVEDSYVDLPKLEYKNEIFVGKFINKDIIPNYLKLITYTTQAEVDVSSVSFSDEYADVYFKNGTYAILDNHKDIQKMILSIKAILDEAKRVNREVLKIDLRYDKVIVLFN